MQITLYYYGKIKQRYLTEGIYEYKEKISHFVPLAIKEIKDNPKLLSKEQKLIKLPIDEKTLSSSLLITLHERGKNFDSQQFAAFIQNAHQRDLTFLIGPPAGIEDKTIHHAHLTLSLSKMTFNHEHVILILLEQLYRAYTIINKFPYHK